MEIIKRRLSDIHPYPNNPRVNDNAVDAVAESIRQCTYISPIIVGEDGVILAGHTRYKALQKLGETEAEVVVKAGLTEEQKRKYRLLDNKTGELADWDFDLLEQELADLDFGDLDLDWGIDLDDEPAEAVEDDYNAEPPEEPRAKMGDIYQLGRHRLMCGDSTNAEDVKKLVGGGADLDICITSPPYGMADSAHLRKHLSAGYDGRDGKTFYGNNTDDKTEWADLMRDFFRIAQEVTKAQFLNVMMVADNKKNLVQFVNEHVDNFVDVIVWNKHTCPPQIQSNVLNNGYEFVFIFDNDNGTRTIRYGNFTGTKSNYIETKKEQNEYADIHKAVFSISFVNEILGMNGNAKTVYEPFGGTGTTLMACEQTGRTCYICEKEPKYCDVIIDRYEKFTNQKAVKIGS